jgi:large subunit ribosomal protein L9
MKKKITLMLKENVENLGIVGDKVSVSLGYARNFLLANGLALVPSDPDYKKVLDEIKEKRAKIEKELESVKEKAEKLSEKEIKFVVKAGEKGKLFGAITAEDIAKEIDIDKKYIVSSPLKTLGDHKVKIKLSNGVVCEIMVKLEAEKEVIKKEK